MAHYDRLRADGKRVWKTYQAFRQAWTSYNDLIERAGPGSVSLAVDGEGGRGIVLKHHHVRLAEKQLLPLAKRVERLLYEFTTEHEHSSIKANDQKELAIAMLRIVDRYLPIEDPMVRRSIESTPSLSMSEIRYGAVAGETSFGMTLDDTRIADRHGVHDVIEGLIELFGMTISDDAVDYLVQNYSADPNVLGLLTGPESGTAPEAFAVPEPAPVPPVIKR